MLYIWMCTCLWLATSKMAASDPCLLAFSYLYFLWVWTRFIDSLLTNIMRQSDGMSLTRLDYKRTWPPLWILFHSHLGCSPWRKSAGVSWGSPVERPRWCRTKACQPPCKWAWKCIPSPAVPSDETAASATAWLQPHGRPSAIGSQLSHA